MRLSRRSLWCFRKFSWCLLLFTDPTLFLDLPGILHENTISKVPGLPFFKIRSNKISCFQIILAAYKKLLAISWKAVSYWLHLIITFTATEIVSFVATLNYTNSINISIESTHFLQYKYCCCYVRFPNFTINLLKLDPDLTTQML